VVVLAFWPKGRDFPRYAVQIHPTNHVAVHAFQRGAARVHVPVVFDLARLVVLGREVERFGFESEVDVLGDQRHSCVGLGSLKAQGGIKDLVVVGAF